LPGNISFALVSSLSYIRRILTGSIILGEGGNGLDHDVERLRRIKALAWFSASELSLVASTMRLANFKRHEVILHEPAAPSEAHILLAGIARLTCRNGRGERVTMSLLAPGPLPRFPESPINRFAPQCEAYNQCRVGSVTWDTLDRITQNTSDTAFKRFHQNDLKQWYRLLLRSSNFLNLGLHERVALTLVELSAEFGVEEARGTLLRISVSHKDIANLVGASRPRVTEHLAQLERESFVIRQGRQLVVRVDKLSDSIGAESPRETVPKLGN
jgi:CRP-like cAMP-binding protein